MFPTLEKANKRFNVDCANGASLPIIKLHLLKNLRRLLPKPIDHALWKHRAQKNKTYTLGSVLIINVTLLQAPIYTSAAHICNGA
jgi:hypothetical protein